ncbi:MAG TPA: MarR family transcriptional regulator [Plantibacter sp.]|uniref:MarR family winged helix-turn-helix transcriptional regulator n=1 Tax=unclassified Plantibacter TaxID=2624265 RepID=UPI002BDBD8B6|nr:MarR family transcriptional regulator [Plantibacter sp.]
MDGRRDEATAASDDLVDALVQTSFITTGVLSAVGAKHDLSLTQMRVLGILRDRRLTMTALAVYLGLDKSTLTGLVSRAEKRGLVERAPSERDRRSVEVFLSAEGLAQAAAATAEVADALEPVLGGVTGPDRIRLQSLLVGLLTAQPSPSTAGS